MFTHIVVWNPRPRSDRNRDNWRGWLWCADHMCSRSDNALLRCLFKRSTLITSSFPWGPTANGLVGQKMLCKFLIGSTYDYIQNTCLCLLSTWMLYHYLSAMPLSRIITWAILSIERPFIHPYAYGVLVLLFTSFTTAVIILLMSLLCYYYCYKTVATDNLCRARLSPGAGELTNHLLRLTNILWLPLCRINKLGFTSHEDCCDPLHLWVIMQK